MPLLVVPTVCVRTTTLATLCEEHCPRGHMMYQVNVNWVKDGSIQRHIESETWIQTGLLSYSRDGEQ